MSHRFDNSSVSENARAHFGDSYSGDHRSYGHELNNNKGSIEINYAADAGTTGPERNRRLLEAAAEQQTPRVIALLKLKADVEFRDEQGLTALHHAVLSGHGDVVHVLLRHGADINARTTKMGSPLSLAALKGDLCMINVLLEARAKVDLPDGPFGTALHCACYNGNPAVARVLVERGALIDSKCLLDLQQLQRFCCPLQDASLGNSGGADASTASGEVGSPLTETWSPLLLATWRGFSDILQLLLEAGCQVNNPCGQEKVTALMVAAKCGNVTAGRMLMQNNANVNAHDREQRTALHHASEHGQEAFIKLLLGGRAQLEALDNANRTPILVAAAWDQTAIIRLLANNGANLSSTDRDGNTLLSFAMQKTNTELAQILADEATKRRGSWRSRLFLSTFDATAKNVYECIVSASEADSPQRLDPILIAAKRGLAHAIPVLHSLGALATCTDAQAWTATHHAAQSGSLYAFKSVLELGASLDAPTNQRETALAIASRAGHTKIVLDALARGADPDVRNSLGLTPLHLSAGAGHAETVRILASRAVNPSAKTIAGDSALHYASRGGHSNVFRALLGRGLNPNLPNTAGRTALHDALDAKTRAALLACYQSKILSARTTQAPVVRAGPRPRPVRASDIADVLLVLITGSLLLAPFIIVARYRRYCFSAVAGTFWTFMPDPSTATGGFSGTLLFVLKCLWKIL